MRKRKNKFKLKESRKNLKENEGNADKPKNGSQMIQMKKKKHR